MQARQFDGRIPSPFIWGLLLLCANSATAQYVVSAKAGTIHQVVGPVFLDDLGREQRQRPASGQRTESAAPDDGWPARSHWKSTGGNPSWSEHFSAPRRRHHCANGRR